MPQVIQFHSPPEHIAACVDQAKEILDATVLTPEEKVALWPSVFEALLDKPIEVQPDVALPALAIPGNARH